MTVCFKEKIFLRSKPLWVVYVYPEVNDQTDPFITATNLDPIHFPLADFSKDQEPILRFKTKREMSMYPFSLRGYVHAKKLIQEQGA